MKTVRIGVFLFVFILTLGTSLSTAAEAAPRIEPFSFTAEDFELSGLLVRPPRGNAHPAVVLVWGSGPTHAARTVERSRLLRLFVEHGYAVLAYDKPGSGESRGSFARGGRLAQRAQILEAAVRALSEDPRIDPERIGFFGSSQAGYVMPRAARALPAGGFIGAWSCPAESSLEQGAYLVEQFLLCAGRGPALSRRAADAYIKRGKAQSYEEYEPAARLLNGLPEIADELGWGAMVAREHFSPARADDEDLYDPRENFAALDVPVLAVFAENDKNIDPAQGAAAYRALLGKRLGGRLTLATIPGADHNMMLAKTGCVQEQLAGYGEDVAVAEEFYAVVARWLETLAP